MLGACSDDSSSASNGNAGQAGGGAGSAGAAGGSSQAGSAGSGNPSAGSGGAPDAGSTPDASSGVEADAAVGFSLSSPAFANAPGCGPDDREACALFPLDNTGLGQARNVSPAIDWTPGPSGTQSYAIALHDLTYVRSGDPYTHWVMWNIPGAIRSLPAELPAGSNPGVPAANTEQVSFRDDDAYAGSGACGNVYEFELYALGTPSFEPSDTESADSVEAALQASTDVLATATMRARSNPDGPCDAQ